MSVTNGLVMSVTNDLVYSLMQPYFSLYPVHQLSDSVIFHFAEVPEEAPSGGEKFNTFSSFASSSPTLFNKEMDWRGHVLVLVQIFACHVGFLKAWFANMVLKTATIEHVISFT